jgi:hypothetical protein
MSITEDVLEKKKPPSYLACPFCPAQAYPEGYAELGYTEAGVELVRYRCTGKHIFFIRIDID